MSNSYEDNLAAATKLCHVVPLASLRDKVDPRHVALIVIDMQNDFCARGGLVDRGGRDVSAVQDMARRLPVLIESARAAGVLVIFVRSVYTTDDNRYLSDVWLEQAARRQGGGYTQIPVCRDGSWEGDYYGDVRPRPGDVVITKHRYNAFHKTDLDTVLRAKGVRTVVVTGVSTNVCVESTAREGFMNDYYVVLVRDGTAAYSHEEHEMTVRNIDRFFGEVSTIEELREIWSGRND
ncbi:MAG TPA: isochorismatase family cysteine hydrolase [Pseudolabrys sp.]|nr:isochorismatase family cysteine hydrolase [Pseudolabrys sp.]